MDLLGGIGTTVLGLDDSRQMAAYLRCDEFRPKTSRMGHNLPRMNLPIHIGADITRPASIGSWGLRLSTVLAAGMGYRVHEFVNSFAIPASSRR